MQFLERVLLLPHGCIVRTAPSTLVYRPSKLYCDRRREVVLFGSGFSISPQQAKRVGYLEMLEFLDSPASGYCQKLFRYYDDTLEHDHIFLHEYLSAEGFRVLAALGLLTFEEARSQQDQRGWIYLLAVNQFPAFPTETVYKIGWTRDLRRRLLSLEHDLVLAGGSLICPTLVTYRPGTETLERRLHEYSRPYQVPHLEAQQAGLPNYTEWFRFRSETQAWLTLAGLGPVSELSAAQAELNYLRSKRLVRQNPERVAVAELCERALLTSPDPIILVDKFCTLLHEWAANDDAEWPQILEDDRR